MTQGKEVYEMKVRCSFCHEVKDGYTRYPERDLLCKDCYAKQLTALKAQIDKIIQGMYKSIPRDKT